MQWSEVRNKYPNQWIVIEALKAHTTSAQQRELDRIAVMQSCADGATAMQAYRQLHDEFPGREFYYVHTNRESLDIRERIWTGIRRGNATVAKV